MTEDDVAMVTVPCIVSTNINSDLKAALKKAKLGEQFFISFLINIYFHMWGTVALG